MPDIHQLRLARWQRIQERGLWRFVIVRGILGYGLLMWLAFSVLAWPRYSHRDWLRFTGMAFLLAMLGGAIFGILMYYFTMWTYRRYKKRFS